MEGSIWIKKISDDRVAVIFDYSKERVEIIRKIPGRKWHPEYKYWSISSSMKQFEQLKIAFAHDEIVFEKGLMVSKKKEKKIEGHGPLILLDNELKLKGYSQKTRKAYMGHVRRFYEYINKYYLNVSSENIKQYFLFLNDNKLLSSSFINQAYGSIKFFVENVMKNDTLMVTISRCKREKKLPEVLCKDEVRSILTSVENLKHRTMLIMAYSSGLRLGEIVRLKSEDIDYQRKLIHVRQGKGKKDRYTILSITAFEVIKEYLKKYKPEIWLFEGANCKDHISERSLQKVFEKALFKSNVKKNASIHTLRHYGERHKMVSDFI